MLRNEENHEENQDIVLDCSIENESPSCSKTGRFLIIVIS